MFMIPVLPVLLTGYSRKSEAPKVEIRDGVEHIQNPSTPLNPEKTVDFEEELNITGKNEDGEIILYQPGYLAVNEEESIYISDRSDMSIKVFDKEGKYLGTFGRKGEGPGKFKRIGEMYFFPNGNLLVHDYIARRTSFFTPEGEFLRSLKWKNSHLHIHWVSNSTITMDDRIYGEKTILSVKTYDLKGEELVSFGNFTYPTPEILQTQNMTYAMNVPYTPRSIFAADPNRKWLYHCLNHTYLIEVYNSEGELFRKIQRPYTPVPFTQEEVKEFREWNKERQAEPFSKIVEEMELPRVKTVTDWMLVDDKGNLWIETNEKKEVNDKTLYAYDIFNKDGFYETRIWTDHRPELLHKGKAYDRVTDEETGERSLKRFKVVWKEMKK